MTHSVSGNISAIAVRLGDHIARAVKIPLPPEVATKTSWHLLDTLGAMISGARLEAGRSGTAFARRFESSTGVTVVGSRFLASPPEAALANGMMGHADETDDSHLEGRWHPGCAVVPAALAASEMTGASGCELIRAIALGYDIGSRVNRALGVKSADKARHSTHSFGGTFGAAAAAATLFHLSEEQARYVMSYATQQVSGVPFWERDTRHVEKAFDFGGMGARNGLTAALLVVSGCSAVDDPFNGSQNLFTAFTESGRPDLLIEDLGFRYDIMATSLKKWCVGSPIQSPLDALQSLIDDHGLTASMVAEIVVHMPDDRLHIVDNRSMPDVCVQHLLALLLHDGAMTFESCHDYERMSDPAILAIRERIRVLPSRDLTMARPARQAIVEIKTVDGQALRYHASAVRGTPENPMAESEVISKVLGLTTEIVGNEIAEKLIHTVLDVVNLPDTRALRPLLQAPVLR